ncbi:hypothetical protein ACO0K0_06330 [Undibacterium sp. SXout11W]|uniref:hypothetical protein n=1 Tax=Undibacterium sp. SXout11W TaxID=3413050 RepID=UPI003BF27C1A
MATDWNAVRDAALGAGREALGSAWTTASSGATAQISALVGIAEYVQENQNSMSADEVSHLFSQQKAALQNVLIGYAGIGFADANNAVAATVNSILSAVPELLGFA